MNRRIILGIAIVFFFLTILSAGVVMSAANSVSTSGLADVLVAVNPNQLKPSECNALSLTVVYFVTPGVPFASTGNTNDLIIGTSGDDIISAGRGSDCVVGGGGNDTIDGEQGDDMLIGGPGDDDLDGGPGADICYGGSGTNIFRRCETIFP